MYASRIGRLTFAQDCARFSQNGGLWLRKYVKFSYSCRSLQIGSKRYKNINRVANSCRPPLIGEWMWWWANGWRQVISPSGELMFWAKNLLQRSNINKLAELCFRIVCLSDQDFTGRDSKICRLASVRLTNSFYQQPMAVIEWYQFEDRC